MSGFDLPMWTPPPVSADWLQYRLHEEYEEDSGEDYFHDHEEEHPMWASDRIELHSVGIDIGSSTSHLMFSRLVLRRLGLSLSSRFAVVSREVTYESPVLLTPYLDQYTIDTKGLDAFISRSYAEAKLTPQAIDTGAVIITGEAAKKENAEPILALFAEQAGKFVCATAGPNLEAVMAAYGSGAVARSRALRDQGGKGSTVMLVDTGGGTCKVAIVQGGTILETVAINVGARLIAWDDRGRLTRIEEAARLVAEEASIDLRLGQVLTAEQRAILARLLADSLYHLLLRQPLSPLVKRLLITPPLTYAGKIDQVMFSGGVSEYLYGRERHSYGDLGEELASEIRERIARPQFGVPLAESAQRIRATVIGASQYTIQVSGNTIFISRQGLLPLRNLKVIAPCLDGQRLTVEAVQQAIQQGFQRFDLVEGEQAVALALHWPMGPSYELMHILARGVAEAMANSIRKAYPLVLVFDSDIGKLVGHILAQELAVGCDVISIDGIQLHEFDYVDIGEEMPDVWAVPVVIKSLLFHGAGYRDRD